MKDWLLLLLRLAAGVSLAYGAGHDKVFDADARLAYTELLQTASIPAAPLLAILFGIIEFFGSLFLAAGFFTRQTLGLLLAAGIGSAALQLFGLNHSVASLFQIQDFHSLGTGYFLVAFVILFIMGPGHISFDAGRKSSSQEDD